MVEWKGRERDRIDQVFGNLCVMEDNRNVVESLEILCVFSFLFLFWNGISMRIQEIDTRDSSLYIHNDSTSVLVEKSKPITRIDHSQRNGV